MYLQKLLAPFKLTRTKTNFYVHLKQPPHALKACMAYDAKKSCLDMTKDYL